MRVTFVTREGKGKRWKELANERKGEEKKRRKTRDDKEKEEKENEYCK